MKKEKPLISQGFRSAPGGTRTHTLSPASDFESDASASSATSAYQLLEYTIIKRYVMQEKFSKAHSYSFGILMFCSANHMQNEKPKYAVNSYLGFYSLQWLFTLLQVRGIPHQKYQQLLSP